MRDHSLKPGMEVEARASDGPHMGGWHPATILEVRPSMFRLRYASGVPIWRPENAKRQQQAGEYKEVILRDENSARVHASPNQHCLHKDILICAGGTWQHVGRWSARTCRAADVN